MITKVEKERGEFKYGHLEYGTRDEEEWNKLIKFVQKLSEEY